MSTFKLSVTAVLAATFTSLSAQHTPVSQMEKLDRGVVALPASSGSGNFVSWRFFGTDNPQKTTFDLLRNGSPLTGATNLTVTNYKDGSGTKNSTYQVVTKVDGEPVDTSKAVQAWDKVWLKLPLERPATGANGGTYSPNDCSVGDVDGDGQYEIFVKWDPSNAKDNSQSGVTDNVYIDCYRLDGTKLWRIDLGRNIRAGAHYTQFQVYDFDGDGRAEMICKTAPGSKDGLGQYVNQAATNETIRAASNTKSHVTSAGRINSGHEYLTVFNGLTGQAVHTIAYYPTRNGKAELSEAAGTFDWDTRSSSDTGSYGNRGERYLAATAYLDGPDGKASGIFTRGYYTYAHIFAVDFDGQRLTPRWLSSHDSNTTYKLTTFDADGNATGTRSFSSLRPTSGSGSGTFFGNGNHNLSIGDVDGDGCDEILWGSAGLDNDGTLLYGTGFGHGDAIHMGQMIAGEPGMQVFQVHEEKGTYAWDLHDAATGRVLYKGGPAGVDNGRGMAAQVSAATKDWWFSSSSERQQRSAATGEVASTANGSVNFRMYWDGTLQDALLDGNTLDKYNDNTGSFGRLVTFYNLGPGSTCNGSKNTPNLSGDILGDWREELILYSVTDAETYLGIYSTNIETPYTVPTLMHDHTYRMGICWQNTAYNQPPHLGYNLAAAMAARWSDETATEVTSRVNEEVTLQVQAVNTKSLSVTYGYAPDGSKKFMNVPQGFTKTLESLGGNTQQMTVSGTPDMTGDYRIAVRLTGVGGDVVNDTLVVHVVDGSTGIQESRTAADGRQDVYNLAGQQLPRQQAAAERKGLRIVRTTAADGRAVARKVIR